MSYPIDVSQWSALAPWYIDDAVFTEYDRSIDKCHCERCQEFEFIDCETGLCAECWSPKEIESNVNFKDRMDED